MPRHHHLIRRHFRVRRRHHSRRITRDRWRSPDYLAQALVAFNRLLRCNRRLAKLAPDFFDTVLVDRRAREREEQRRWRAEWEPAIKKAYGLPPEFKDEPADAVPPLPAPRIQHLVELELEQSQRWSAAARLGLRRYRERRPHAVASLSQIARLTWIAFQLRRWAAGMPDQPEPPAPPASDPWADLARAYPASDSTAESAADDPVVEPVVAAPASPSGSSAAPPVVPVIPGPNPLLSSPPPGAGSISTGATACVGRRDVWSSLARHQRQLFQNP